MTSSSVSATVGAIALESRLTGVLGGRTAAAFEKAFGMRTAADLLAHYPRRYATRGELTALSDLPFDENVTIIAEVLRVQERPMRARRGSIVEVKISDGDGILTLTFFNQAWRSKELVPGVRGIFAGKVSAYRGALQLAHPDYELFEQDAENAATRGGAAAREWAQTPIPIYPATGTVASWQVQKAVGLVLDALGPCPDPVPAAVVAERGLLGFRDALEGIHRPQKTTQWQRARAALRFHEAFVLQTALLQQRAEARAVAATPRHAVPGGVLERFDSAQLFSLTNDQLDVGRAITHDLGSVQAMHRLVQGEVGSGKTLVALRAMLTVADSGGQSVLLAPTEVLAAQHLRSIAEMLGPELSAELMPTVLTGQLSTAERKRALLRTVSGQSRIVIGTHALLSDTVSFFDLGLVVVDEQHRFGVEQREALRAKGGVPPHVLVLTATPIPRTVAMTVFGDLDVSTITQLPVGRQGIESFVVPLADRPGWERRIWERASEEVAGGRQVFVVCPAISAKEGEDDSGSVPPSDDVDTEETGASHLPANVASVAAHIRADPLFAQSRVGVLHGRLSSDEKDVVMRAFASGGIDVLIATTVIEVGVNVPNASVMIVLDADRFGVSQLHQLRGRVGRGSIPGLCLLVTYAKEGSPARERVDAVAATLDGFELAHIDLALRREGDVLGSRQSGSRSSLKLLRVVSDGELIAEARAAAAATLDDGGLVAHPALAAALARRLDESERAFLGTS